MKPQEAVMYLNKQVRVNGMRFKQIGMSELWLFTAYIFRIVDNKKVYQAEIRNLQPPHEIYVVNLEDLEGVQDDEMLQNYT